MTTPMHMPAEELIEQRYEGDLPSRAQSMWCSRAEEKERDRQ